MQYNLYQKFKEIKNKSEFLKERYPLEFDDNIMREEKYCSSCYQIIKIKDYKIESEEYIIIKHNDGKYLMLDFEQGNNGKLCWVDDIEDAEKMDREEADLVIKKNKNQYGINSFNLIVGEKNYIVCPNAPKCHGNIYNWFSLSSASIAALEAYMDKLIEDEEHEKAALIKKEIEKKIKEKQRNEKRKIQDAERRKNKRLENENTKV